MPAAPVFTGQSLSLGYRRHVLLQNFSFEIQRGEILGIVGPNGSGKSTLLRTILGLLKPLTGSVERSPGLSISYMPQRGQVDSILPITALEVVLMGCSAKQNALRRVHAEDRDAAESALASVGVAQLRDRLFRNLSGGQQQRVMLARAIAPKPDVLVLDEPMAGMDVASEAAMIEFLKDLNRVGNVTILVVTHLLTTVLNLATSVMLMGGETILQGPAEEVLQEGPLTQLYGVRVRVGEVGGLRTLVVGNQEANRA